MKLQIGQKVKWNDPCINDFGEDAEEQLNKVWEVCEIKTTNEDIQKDDIIVISDGISETEVFLSELTII